VASAKPDTKGQIAPILRVATPDATAARTEQALIDALPLGVALLKPGGRQGWVIAAANIAFDEIAGLPQRHALGLTMAQLTALDPAGELSRRVASFVQSGGAASMDFDWRGPGYPRDRHFSVRLNWLADAVSEQPTRLQLSIRDRSSEVEQARSLRDDAMRDPLTGLYNHIGFTETIDAVGISPVIAVILIDLQRFSRIVDSLGHTAGDELLLTVARRILSVVGPNDTVSRLDGDTFGILTHLVDGPGDALHLAGRCHEAIARSIELSGREIHQTVAIGIAFTDSDDIDGDEMLRNAEFAMQRAKRLGIKTEIFRPGEALKSRRRFTLEADLRRAIEAGALTVAYQPLVRFGDNKMSSVEALARWEHPARGPISPNDFIPLAEETGLIMPLGRLILDTACREIACLRRELPTAADLQVAVNISGIQIAGDEIVETVCEALVRSGLPGHALKLELTESAIIANPQRAVRVLGDLKKLEARISMDDFGTGYSSLSYLQRLPIDVLKIDRSFIADLMDYGDSYQIVGAMLSLARALKMESVAEGIETAEQAERLAAMGCTYGQGFYFAPPLAIADLKDYLLSGNVIAPVPEDRREMAESHPPATPIQAS
jgi:diguanylate cyclase (GGDEF)-like protein